MKLISVADCCDILDNQRVPVTANQRKKGIFPYYGANGVQDYVDDYIFDDELVLVAEDGGHFGSKQHPIAYRVSGKCWVNNHAHVLKPQEGLDVDYLCYSLMYYPVSTLVKGATRKKLNQAALREMKIKWRTLEEQKNIVSVLKEIELCITICRKMSGLLNEHVKSRFVEMFGTPNEMDKWPCCNVEDIADVTVGLVIKPTRFYTEDTENGVKAFRSLNVREMRVNDSDWVYFSKEGNDQNKKSQVQKGDVLVVRSGYPGTSCVVTDEYAGCNAIDIMIARPQQDKINPHYLCAFNNFPHGMNQIRHGTGGAAQKHFNVGAYNKVIIPVPPIELQNRFVEFLQLADKSKFAVQRSIDTLQTLKTKLMQEYFG